jgi:large subunit ribosomal protein L25
VAGTQILASDLVLPSGSTLLLDPETLIVNITEQQSQEALEAELEEAEAEAGIERDDSDSDVDEVGAEDGTPTEGEAASAE